MVLTHEMSPNGLRLSGERSGAERGTLTRFCGHPMAGLCGDVFIRNGGTISDRGVQTGSIVSADVLTDDRVQDLIVIEEAPMDRLGFHRMEERFHKGVVVELATPPHALKD